MFASRGVCSTISGSRWNEHLPTVAVKGVAPADERRPERLGMKKIGPWHRLIGRFRSQEEMTTPMVKIATASV
jgi:hypothetical protein